jgi:hypothetical protein
MNASKTYRSNAEDCLRIARTAHNEHDRPFWLSLAQSWLELAEHSARSDEESNEPRIAAGTH